jgi:hypothetical protein
MPVRKERKPPKIGTKYERAYKGTTYTMTVVDARPGVAYSVGGKVYASPTGAAKAVTKTEVNGWDFWGIESN